MDTGSSFLGGGWGSTFAGGGSGNAGQGYSSGLLNGGSGFGTRGPTAFGQTAFGLGADNNQLYSTLASQKDLAQLQNAGETQRAQIAAKAQDLPARLAQKRFGQVFPYIQNALKSFGGNPYSVGGGTPPQPAITAAPVWSQQQVNEQINNQQAQNTASTASNVRNMQQQLAGRGFGANSPLAMALAGQQQSANMANNSTLATSTRFNTAQANAQQLLSGQQAQESQWTDLQNAQIERAKPYFQLQGQLLSALGGLGR